MRLWKYLVAFGGLSVVAACSSYMARGPQEYKIDQLVIFHHSFVNYAWGYQNRGWFIDKDGYMKAYTVRSTNDWTFIGRNGPDSGYISHDSLMDNYFEADKIIYKIPPKELYDKFLLIPWAAAGELSPRTRSAYDAGLVDFACYWWDESRQKFKYILLSQSGDWSQTNLEPSAIELDHWLKSLNQYYVDSMAPEPE